MRFVRDPVLTWAELNDVEHERHLLIGGLPARQIPTRTGWYLVQADEAADEEDRWSLVDDLGERPGDVALVRLLCEAGAIRLPARPTAEGQPGEVEGGEA